MAVTVRMHGVAGAKDAGQSTGDGRMGEELGKLRDGGQDVVAGIPCGGEYFFGLSVHGFVEAWRKVGLYGYEATDDEFLHLRIIQ